MNGDDIIGLIGYVIGGVLGWVVPVYFGVKTAKSKGYSPHWMWFGIYPISGWITWIILACLSKRHQCPNCGGFLGSQFRICPYCCHNVESESGPQFRQPVGGRSEKPAIVSPKPTPHLLDEFTGEPSVLAPVSGSTNTTLDYVVRTVAVLMIVFVVCITIVTNLGTTVSGTFSKVNPAVDFGNSAGEPIAYDPDLAAKNENAIGWSLISSEQYDEVLRRANASIASNPAEPTPYALRGEMRCVKKDFDRAAPDLSTAINILEGRTRSRYWDKQLGYYYFTRSNCYSRLSNPDRAWIDINKAIGLLPNHAGSLNNRGVLRENDYQDFKGALEDYEFARRLDPQETLYQSNATRVSHQLGR